MAVHLVGLQEVSDLVKRLETTAPDLVRETVPKVVGLSLLTDVVRRLIDERISVRDFETVLGALAEHGAHQADPVLLTEQVRCALSLQIAHDHAGPSGRLGVVLVEPEIEQTLREAIVRGADGSHLALEPELRQALVARIEAAVGPLQTAGAPPVLLTEVDVRRYLHKLLEGSVPGVVVLSLQELPGHLTVQPLGQVTLEEPEELQRRVA
jgi:type III secretion protein V